MKALKIITACASIFAMSNCLIAAPILVGNASLNGLTLNESDIKAVLLGKKVSLNGKRVVIVMAKSNEGQEAFLQSRLGKTVSQFNNHWRKLFMTGSGTSPTQVKDISELVSTISATDGAVGIVEEANAGDLVVVAK